MQFIIRISVTMKTSFQVLQSCVRCKLAFKSMKILFDIARNFEQRANVLNFLRSMNPRVLDIMIRENVQQKNKGLQILPVIVKRIQVSGFVFCSYVCTHASNCSTILLPELVNLCLTKISPIKSVVITYDVSIVYCQPRTSITCSTQAFDFFQPTNILQQIAHVKVFSCIVT